jgi:SAM-dependent methyltransferase
MNQREYWNSEAAEVWISLADRLDPMLEPFGAAAIAALAPRAGERVLDIGCGAGATTRALAERVGPAGKAIGVDVSAALVAVARARGGAEFHACDAGSDPLPGAPFDAAFSRFGVMFFEDPPAAFAHLRAALRPGGRIAFVCWRTFGENPWAYEPLPLVQPHLREPLPVTPPGAPGPFAFGDGARLQGILEAAGWTCVTLTPLDTDYLLGPTPEAAAAISLRLGPLGRVIRTQRLDADLIRGVLEDLLRRHMTDRGVLMDAACWIVTGQA